MSYRTPKTQENSFLPQSELIPKYSLPRYYKSPTEEAYYGNFFKKNPAHPNISTQHSNASYHYNGENIYPYSLPPKPPLKNQNFNENYYPQNFAAPQSSYGNYDYYESNSVLLPASDGYENYDCIYKNQFSPSIQPAYRNPNMYDEKYVQVPLPNNYRNSDVYYRQKSAVPLARNKPQYFENDNSIQPFHPSHPSYSNPQHRNLNNEREYGGAQIQYGSENYNYRTDEISTSYRNHSPINGIDIPPKPPVRTSSLKQSNKENEGYPANCNYFKENQTSYERKLVHQNFPQSTNPKNYGHEFRDKNFYSNSISESNDSRLIDKENVHRHNRNQRNTNNYDKTILSPNNQENERPAFHKYFQVNPTPLTKSSLNKYANFLQRSTKYGNEKLAVNSSVEKIDSRLNATVITRKDDLLNENKKSNNQLLLSDNQQNDQQFLKDFEVNPTSAIKSSQIKHAKYSPKSTNSSTCKKFHERNSKYRNNFSESGSTDSGFSDAQNGFTPTKNNENVKNQISTFADEENQAPPIRQDLCVDPTKNVSSQHVPKFDIYNNKDCCDEKVNLKFGEKNDKLKPVRRVSGDGFHTTVSGHLGLNRQPKNYLYDNHWPSISDNKKQFDECSTPSNRQHQKSEEILQKVPESKSQDEHTILKEDVEITVSVGEFLQQIEKWNDANMDQKLLKNVEESNYHQPSKIQKHVIPYIQNGYNVKCQNDDNDKSAATFLIPLIDNLIKDLKSQSLPYNGPVCLIISPTRELAQKNYEEAKKFAYGTGITVSCCYGQYNAAQNLADLQNGCNILCACVGRLMTFVQNGNLSISNVRYLVIEQTEKFIDSRYDSDFGILKLLNYPLFPAKDKRQTILLSATFKDPAMQQFCDEHVNAKKTVSITSVNQANA